MISNFINSHQDFLALAVCLILVMACYMYQTRNGRRLICSSAVLYTFFVAWKTVFSRSVRDTIVVTDFLWSYRAMLNGGTGMLSQIYLNILLFVPFGLFTYTALTVKRKGIWTTILGMAFSSSIEFMQLYFHRGTCELDDILNNTIGAIIGALTAYSIECICTKQEKRNGKN